MERAVGQTVQVLSTKVPAVSTLVGEALALASSCHRVRAPSHHRNHMETCVFQSEFLVRAFSKTLADWVKSARHRNP